MPTGIDIAPDGTIYVANAGSDQILVIGPDGALERRLGRKGNGDGEFDLHRPGYDPFGGVTVAPDGSLYVADAGNHRVQVVDTQGTSLRTWGSFGSGNGQFNDPIDVAIAPDGSVYVVDDFLDRIQQFTPEGAWLRTIGSHGSGDGQMSFTCGIEVESDGTLLLADCGNHRVEAWSPDGTFLWSVGSFGTGPGQFDYNGDLVVDRAGNIYVFEATRIQVLGPDRQPIAVWQVPDATALKGVMGIALDSEGFAWVLRLDALLKLKVVVPGAAP